VEVLAEPAPQDDVLDFDAVGQVLDSLLKDIAVSVLVMARIWDLCSLTGNTHKSMYCPPAGAEQIPDSERQDAFIGITIDTADHNGDNQSSVVSTEFLGGTTDGSPTGVRAGSPIEEKSQLGLVMVRGASARLARAKGSRAALRGMGLGDCWGLG
jgi:hypothetical protein